MRIVLILSIALTGFLWSFAPVSDHLISGKVTDQKGGPIAGVSITVKGTRNSVVSSSDGSFKILVKEANARLVFSYVGFVTQEVAVSANSGPLLVHMVAANQKLEEVVVVGYGRSRGKPARDRRKATRYSANSAMNAPVTEMLAQGKPGATARFGNGHSNWRQNNNYEREGYDGIVENRFLDVKENPLSTFSIDVDAASYSNIRRFLSSGQMPTAGAVRIEEMINYFHYEYPQPRGEDPFSINTELAPCPWNPKHQLALIGLQGRQIDVDRLPASNLVFLIDVSGSMMAENKLPLVRRSMKLLVDQLRPRDRVAIVVYAGNAGLVLPSTSGEEKSRIKDAIDRLEAGGSTAGGAGIKLAYKVASEHFMKGGNNRVILCTDGDFNVGESSDDAMERLIEKERQSGVFLTVLGYGMGNYQDAKMQKLADKGNGNHAYIDNFMEARKVLVSEFGGTLFTIAKDVKLQVEFNPAVVQAYRLIGYENRLLNKEDFNNDKKDAGELGSGHTVTALYEIIPVGVRNEFEEKVDKLKYQNNAVETDHAGNEIMTVKFRYKQPDQEMSKLIEHPVRNSGKEWRSASANFRFAAAVAEFGMLLRNSEFKQASSYESVWNLAHGSLGEDREGYRAEFLRMVRNAESLAGGGMKEEDLTKKGDW